MNFPTADGSASTVQLVPQRDAAMSAGGSFMHMAVSLVLVLLAIFALAWVLRWLQGARTGGAGVLRIHGSLQVGAKERVLLIQAGDTHLLIGVAPGRVQNLHAFSEPPSLPADAAQAASDLPATLFADKLRQAMKKGLGL
jgi:flagellar protein FliO/FliZ